MSSSLLVSSGEMAPQHADEVRTDDAGGELDTWIAGARALALLHAAVTSGIFDLLRVPMRPEQVATALGQDVTRIGLFCTALYAHGVVEYVDQGYVLARSFVALSAPGGECLSDTLRVQPAWLRAIEHSPPGVASFTDLPAEDIQAVGLAAAGDPSSDASLAFIRLVADAMPEIRTRWEHGARHLVAGCGAGGMLLSTLAAFPSVQAVGIDIDAGLLEIAQQRARELQVTNRLELVCIDVRDLPDSQAFDTALWSQPFFPAHTHADTLAVLYRLLKPGGYVFAPIAGGEPPAQSDLQSPAGRAYSLRRLVFSGWALPMLTAEELGAEFVSAGFAVAPIVHVDEQPYLLAHRPDAGG